MNKKDGGKAFPGITIRQDGDPAYHSPTKIYHGGMTLRDYFAGQALAGLLGNRLNNNVENSQIAEICYVMADAIMEVRDAENN